MEKELEELKSHSRRRKWGRGGRWRRASSPSRGGAGALCSAGPWAARGLRRCDGTTTSDTRHCSLTATFPLGALRNLATQRPVPSCLRRPGSGRWRRSASGWAPPSSLCLKAGGEPRPPTPKSVPGGESAGAVGSRMLEPLVLKGFAHLT